MRVKYPKMRVKYRKTFFRKKNIEEQFFSLEKYRL